MRQEMTLDEKESESLLAYKDQLNKEWLSILDYWAFHVVDTAHGGFYGSVNNENVPDTNAPKGIVMNSRILWAFSSSYNRLQNKTYLEIANRAFNYIINYFIDDAYGAVYWSVDKDGVMVDGRKKVYGLAFCIYGMSEYYKATKNEDALRFCKKIFEYIELYSFDKEHGGYIGAFSRDWKMEDDLRLSEKDYNAKKTMNTQLHLAEAYSNLYSVWPDEEVKQKIEGLLENFDKHLINKRSFHLNLFMDEQWNPLSSLISFGHDIEASWLLLQCATTVQSHHYMELFKNYAVEIGYAAAGGLDKDGGLWFESEPLNDLPAKEKHSWAQAEAMIGFLNIYQLTGSKQYLQYSLNSWQFVKDHIIDKEKGGWFWGVNADNTILTNKDKAGFWKCPYHTTRACMEIIDRINSILATQ